MLAVLWFTTPSYGADPSGCPGEDTTVVQNVVLARLYRADCGIGSWYLVREKTTATAHEESIAVDTTGCMTYGVTTVNAAGLESSISCMPVISFPRQVSVEPLPIEKSELFDLAGRRVSGPLRKGVYFQRVNGKKRVVVVRE